MPSHTLYLRTLDNKTLTIKVDLIQTVAALKQFISLKHDIPIECQQLFYEGRLLKDNRDLSHYQIDYELTKKSPLLITQTFKIDVFISKKALFLYSLTAPYKANDDIEKQSKALSQHSVDCNPMTTVSDILVQLNLDHLSHLIKVCVGAGSEDIRDMNRKIMEIPGLLNEGILSILFSARWFIDRTADISSISTLISNIIQKSNQSSKALKGCISFGRMQFQFEKTQSMILTKFEEIDNLLNQQTKEIQNASKWFTKVMQDNEDKKVDKEAEKLIFQLQNKVENIEITLKTIKRKWIKKRKQIVLYLQKSVRDSEAVLFKSFRSWIASDIVQWLQYMDDRIVFDDDIISKFVNFGLNGYNLSDLNDLSLKLMGINDMPLRQLIIGYIDTLLTKYSDNKGSHSPYCHSASCSPSTCSDTSCDSENGAGHDKNVCCICVTKQVSTVIVPCGHATYCNDCSTESVKHSNRCPICRTQITSILTIYKAGLDFSDS